MYSSILSYTQYAGTPTTYGATGTVQPATIPATSYFYIATTWSLGSTSVNPLVTMTTLPQFQVQRRGIYTITFAFGATPSSGDVEIFLSKNLGNGADLVPTAVGQLLASSRVFTQQTVTWTGYLTTTDFFSVGGYAQVAVTPTANCELTIVLVDGAEGPTGQTGPGTSATTLQSSLTITATTTNPTITTTTIQQTNYNKLGDQYRVRYRLGWSSATAGSGNYLVTLPAGLTFNTIAGYNPTYTGTIWSPSVSAMAPYVIPCVGGVVQSGNWNGTAYVVPYSSTQFRVILTNNNTNSFDVWGSTWYPLSVDGMFHVEFDMWA